MFASDVVDRADAEAGDFVKVVDPKGKSLGTAHFSSTSQIVLRLLSQHVEPIDQAFFFRRCEAALRFREQVVKNTNAYRLIHAEGDLLPGLIVDRYGDYLAMQLLDQGMDRQAGEVLAALTQLVAPRGVMVRNDVAVRAKENLPLESKVIAGEIPKNIDIEMNGFSLTADLLGGQKTGIFLDQRENYLAVAEYARGGRALDCFTGTGGFALHLAREMFARLKGWIVRLQLSKRRAEMPRRTTSTTSNFTKRTRCNTCLAWFQRGARLTLLLLIRPRLRRPESRLSRPHGGIRK